MAGRGRGDGGAPETALDAWYQAADEILRRLKRQNEMPKTGKELMKFLKVIGYEKKRSGQGDHAIFEFRDKNKFQSFLEEMAIRDVNIELVPIAETVSVDTGGTNPATVAGVIHRVFGLDALGQKPPRK